MSDSRPFVIGGRPLVCRHCEHDRFERRVARLEGTLESLVSGDVIFRKGTMFVCGRCRYVHWFFYPDVVEGDDASEPADCLSCGGTIPPGTSECPSCGWSYGAKEPVPGV